MSQGIDWILKNKEWFLSGIGISIPLAIIGWIYSRKNSEQSQRGGKNSVNIQASGDVTIHSIGAHNFEPRVRMNQIEIILPKLKHPIQIAGLLIIVFGIVLIHALTPNNVKAMISVGSIGIAFQIFAQLPRILPMFPERHRATVFIITVISFFTFCIGMVKATSYFVLKDYKDKYILESEAYLTTKTNSMLSSDPIQIDSKELLSPHVQSSPPISPLPSTVSHNDEIVIDQRNEPNEYQNGMMRSVCSSIIQSGRQKFVPSMPVLTGVDLWARGMSDLGGNKVKTALVVTEAISIESIEKPLASKVIEIDDSNGWKYFDLGQIKVVPGKEYFLTLFKYGDGVVGWYGDETINRYPRGNFSLSGKPFNFSQYFRTYARMTLTKD